MHTGHPDSGIEPRGTVSENWRWRSCVPLSNRYGIGARLTLKAGGKKLLREVNPFGSYQSQSTYWVHFGLAAASSADKLTVRWPSGTVQELANIPSNRRITIVEGKGLE